MKSIITFYSYKGGVGRTMALANVAVLLAQRGLHVLAVDWDLEAPGLERYFGYFTVEQRKGGLLSLLREEHKGSRGHYREHLSRVTGTVDGSSSPSTSCPVAARATPGTRPTSSASTGRSTTAGAAETSSSPCGVDGSRNTTSRSSTAAPA